MFFTQSIIQGDRWTSIPYHTKPLSIVNASPTFREVQTEAGKQLDEMAVIVETVLAKEVKYPFTTHPEI
jgi:hypothetical protein